MRALFVMTLLAALVLPTVAFAEIQTITATHTYIMGDHDSKDDARQRCLLEAKRKVLEQAGVYIESASEVKNFDLTKDKITSFAAAVMQVKDTKEEVGFQQGHMTLTLKLTAQVDLVEVRKQLAARQVDASVRDTVAAQQERLKRLEAQLEAMQRQQDGKAFGHAPASPPIDISAKDLQTLHTQAAQGYARAQYMIGTRYTLGWGVPQDHATARQWYEKAAAQGYASAQVLLGASYESGQGVPQDYAKARKWYEQAAAQGDAWAQFRLGVLYWVGYGVLRDYAKARQWYEKAAAQGNARAQLSLGEMYENGHGVPQDYTKAQQWYEQAAPQGDGSAQDALGMLYHKGQGVPQDYAKARQWYEKAAAQGFANAQYELGLMYEQGQGVPQDYVFSYMWFSLAVQGPSLEVSRKDRGESLERLQRTMSPEQIQEAQRLARDWTAKQQIAP
jgi:TPR repeat protein